MENWHCSPDYHPFPLSTQSFFSRGAEIQIELTDFDKRKKVDVKNEEGKKEKLPLYLDGETVSGKVSPPLQCMQDLLSFTTITEHYSAYKLAPLSQPRTPNLHSEILTSFNA